VSARYNGEYQPKNRDRIEWERDRARLKLEAKLFIDDVVNAALYELAMERGICGPPLDGDREHLILKHVIGQLCDPARREAVKGAAISASVELKIPEALREITDAARPAAGELETS
jgi:hypothetical protein